MATPTPTIRNGADTAQVYGTLDALKAQPQLGHFEFRVSNRWIDGPHSRSTIQGFWGAGAEDSSPDEPFVVDSEPPILFGADEAPNPALGANRAYAFLARTALGLRPQLA